jgi:hypothetical protein
MENKSPLQNIRKAISEKANLMMLRVLKPAVHKNYLGIL